MALNAAQVAALRSLGALVTGGALHTGLNVNDARGLAGHAGGRPFDMAPMPDNPNIGAANRLADEMVSEPLNFDAGVVYIPGEPQHNAMYVDTPENHEAFVRQSDEEHRHALQKYLNDPNIPPDRAVRLGMREEQKLPKWWNDHDPRLPVTPSSSCVSSVRLGPNGDIYIKFDPEGIEYQYEGSPDPVEASRILAQLVTSDSIGKAVNSWSGFWGKAHTYLPKG